MGTRDKHAVRIGPVIRALRIAKGWSLQDLGDEAGYERGFIGEVERGEKTPGLQTLRNIAQALGTTANAIMVAAAKGLPPPNALKHPPRQVARLTQDLGNLHPKEARQIVPVLQAMLRAFTGAPRKTGRG